MHPRHCFALALLILPLSLAQADGRHVTDITEKHAVIAERRPDDSSVKAARRLVDKLKAGESNVINTMRILGTGDARLREDPHVHGRLALPPLGELQASSDHQPDSWVLLRLLALLRAGYPGDPGLQGEIKAWLASARPSRKHEWADASLELLTLQALVQRGDRTLAGLAEPARKRGREIASSRDWTRDNPDEPSLYVITNQLHFVLARQVAITNGWADVDPGCTAEIATRLCDALRKTEGAELWIDVPEDQDAVYCRALMVMAALLGVVVADPTIDRSIRSDARNGLELIATRLPDAPEKKDGWRCFKGDALLFALTGGEELGKARFRRLRDNAAELALGRNRYVFGTPRPHNSHMAAGLRWVLCRSFGDPGMGRDKVELEDRDTAAALCLSLLATTGGLLESPRAALDWAEGVSQFRAFETLDLDDYYGYMVKTDLAIDASARWLLSRQQKDGMFMGGFRDVLGAHGLAVHALLEAGVSRDDPKFRKAWDAFLSLAEACLKRAEEIEGIERAVKGWHNYSCSIALMAWQSYYEPEIHESGMYRATTYEAYHDARARLWPKIPERERKLIAEMSWRLSNADGYGWSYNLPKMKTPVPGPVTAEPDPAAKGPVTGGKPAVAKEVEDERRRRSREGRFPPRPTTPLNGVRHGDNSNSQYSVLGLKAAMTLGAPMDVNTLAWEAERLIDGFRAHGFAERLVDPTRLVTLEQLEKRARDSRYAADDPNVTRLRPDLQPYPIGGWSYFCNGVNTWGDTENKPTGYDEDGDPIYRWPYTVAMTAAGVSSLAIIRDALLIADTYDPQLIARVDDYIAGGIYGLGLKYPYNREFFKVDTTLTECWRGGGDGYGMLYDMYSCERAGVLTGKVYFANTEWYRDGADLLMKDQNKAGGWTPIETSVCNTSWAILFLKRSAPYLATRQPPHGDGPVTGR